MAAKASARVFALPELLENILIQVGPQMRAPIVTQLLALRRVNSTFQATITRSKPLQKKMMKLVWCKAWTPIKGYISAGAYVVYFGSHAKRVVQGSAVYGGPSSMVQSWRDVRINPDKVEECVVFWQEVNTAHRGLTLYRDCTCMKTAQNTTWGMFEDWMAWQVREGVGTVLRL